MTIANSEVKLSSAQIFAYNRDYQVPFYNRVESRREILERFEDAQNSRGLVYFISAPLGTGKTFFIDEMSKELEGRQTPQLPFYAKELKAIEDLRGFKKGIIYVDEADIKTTWKALRNALDVIKGHTEKTGQRTIVLGDYVLKNKDLVGHLENIDYLRNFEALDKKFLMGVLEQRVEHFLGKKGGASIVADELYEILTPLGLSTIATFRSIMTMLSQMVEKLPYNSRECRIDLDLAKKWVEKFDPLLTIDRQHDFLNLFLDFITEKHPRGIGLKEGLNEGELYLLGRNVGYKKIEKFRDEILEPFSDNGLLMSTGMPYLSDKGTFVRYPEPYLPTSQTLLFAEL